MSHDRLAHGLLLLFYLAAMILAATAVYAVLSRLIYGVWPQ